MALLLLLPGSVWSVERDAREEFDNAAEAVRGFASALACLWSAHSAADCSRVTDVCAERPT